MTSNVHGFTLVELVVAILIFAIGITGIAKLQMEVLRGGVYGNNYNDAVNYAKDLTEQYESLDSIGTFENKNLTSVTGVKYTSKVVVSKVSVCGSIQARKIVTTVTPLSGLFAMPYEITTMSAPIL